MGYFRHRKASGETVRVESSLTSDGEYVYALMRDTVAESCTEERLQAFLLSTSHDLRTPAHTIQCAAQLLSARPGVLADAEASELLRAVRASSIVMQDTTSNVLLLRNKCSRAQCDLSAREVVDVRATFQDALSIALLVFNPAAAAHGQVTYDEALPAELLGDAEAVRRLLSNLIVSACLLMQSGGKAARIESAVFSRIQDEGARVGVDATLSLVLEGLPADVIETMFDPYRGVCCTALCVARALARSMGGEVEASDGDEHVHITAQFWLHRVNAELSPGFGGEPEEPEAAAEPSGEEAVVKPTPPMAELTTRMMESMTGAFTPRSCTQRRQLNRGPRSLL